MQLTAGSISINPIDKSFRHRSTDEKKESLERDLFENIDNKGLVLKEAPFAMSSSDDKSDVFIPKRASHLGLNAYADVIRGTSAYFEPDVSHQLNQQL